MAFTLCTLADAIADAGRGANWDYSTSGANMTRWSDQIEGMINTETLKDWNTDLSTVKGQFSGALAIAVSAMIANKAIKYDVTKFIGGLAEAQFITNVNIDTAKDILAELKRKDQAQKKMTT